MKAEPLKQGKNDEGKTIYEQCEPSEATHLTICMPGPVGNIIIAVHTNVRPVGNSPNWYWNGDVENPTLKPSVLTTRRDMRCHSFITNGVVDFLRDTTHEYSGQKVPLLEVVW